MKPLYTPPTAKRRREATPADGDGMSARKKALWAALVCLAAALFALGAANGGALDMLAKAVKICSECIGIG